MDPLLIDRAAAARATLVLAHGAGVAMDAPFLLRALATPCLIVQGTRDPLGTADEVHGYPLSASIRLHWLADGDHSFEPRKASGHTLAGHMASATAAAADFILERSLR